MPPIPQINSQKPAPRFTANSLLNVVKLEIELEKKQILAWNSEIRTRNPKRIAIFNSDSHDAEPESETESQSERA